MLVELNPNNSPSLEANGKIFQDDQVQYTAVANTNMRDVPCAYNLIK